MLILLLLRGGPIIILCGRDFWTTSGETLVAYMLCGRALRSASGVAGGETAMAAIADDAEAETAPV